MCLKKGDGYGHIRFIWADQCTCANVYIAQ